MLILLINLGNCYYITCCVTESNYYAYANVLPLFLSLTCYFSRSSESIFGTHICDPNIEYKQKVWLGVCTADYIDSWRNFEARTPEVAHTLNIHNKDSIQ